MSELKDSILKTGTIKNNIGHYIQKIIKENSYESICEELRELMQEKMYSRISTILSISDSLPVEFSEEELKEFIECYKVENPIIFDSVFRAITICRSKVFPEDEFKALTFEDKNIEFTVKYLLASNEFIDPFVRDEYYKMIDGLCPDKLRNSFNAAVS